MTEPVAALEDIPATPDARKAALSRIIASQVVDGCRVESQSDYDAVVVKGHRPNNVLHLIFSIVTGGAWFLVVWLPILIFGGEKRRMVTVDEYGRTSVHDA